MQDSPLSIVTNELILPSCLEEFIYATECSRSRPMVDCI